MTNPSLMKRGPKQSILLVMKELKALNLINSKEKIILREQIWMKGGILKMKNSIKIILLIFVCSIFQVDSFSQTWTISSDSNKCQVDSILIRHVMLKELLMNDAAIYNEQVHLLIDCLPKVAMIVVDSIIESESCKLFLIKLVQDSNFVNCYYRNVRSKDISYHYFSSSFFDSNPWVVVHRFYNSTIIYRITGFTFSDIKLLVKDDQIDFPQNKRKLKAWMKASKSSSSLAPARIPSLGIK